MGVSSSRELPRTAEYELGQPVKLNRAFVLTLSNDTLANNPTVETEIFAHLGIDIGSQHPTYTQYRVRSFKLTEGYEGSPYHIHVSFEYGLILANELLSPTSRVPVWEFDSQPGEVPALFYYDDTNTRQPLTNSAYDFFPGLVAPESLVVAKVTQNFASFPSSWFGAQNAVNASTYLGAPKHTIKVVKITVNQQSEQFGNTAIGYWQAKAELHYRESGHNLRLPDIGWNFLDSGEKRRAMVFDFKNGEWVASANPIGLNGSGQQTFGAPAILDRRISPEADFSTLFGTPPTTPLPF